MTPAAPDEPPRGERLRAQRRLRNQLAVQDVALRLMQADGYAATTVERICEEAGISPATFYRWFPAKEDVVLFDWVDVSLLDVSRTVPPEVGLTEAVIATIGATVAGLSERDLERERARQTLAATVPELRGRLFDQFTAAIDMISAAAAERTGRDPHDELLRVWASAVAGVLVGAMMSRGGVPGPNFDASMIASGERALRLFDAHFTVDLHGESRTSAPGGDGDPTTA